VRSRRVLGHPPGEEGRDGRGGEGRGNRLLINANI